MEIIESIEALRERLSGESSRALVPTMGNLHAGHLALVRKAGNLASCTVASIFVNRLQFGEGEDFDRYPRTFEEDCRKLVEAGTDILFAPTERELYPEPQQFTVDLPPVAKELCGAHRPGHFSGMATVVLKLFNIVNPHHAVFGKKDYQQLHLVKGMVSQFNLSVKIAEGDTIREEDGLAMSSRNRYLSPDERAQAPRLYFNLEKIASELRCGNRDFSVLEKLAGKDLEARGWMVDYVEIRDALSLAKPCANSSRLVVLGAARLGKTRLIDNLEAGIAQW
ncbi:MAG: pantoate--beta-alanine ligase [Burkholderiales bacterium]|nr:pantoate--beta-alanine ligase [Burkholderiales bacterium]